MKKPALIFDLDGTLWDSAAEVAEAWSEAGRRYLGSSFSLNKGDVYREMGKTMDQIVADLIPDQGDAELMKRISSDLFKTENEYLEKHPGKAFPDVVKTLRLLKEKGYRLYIVSNCQAGYIETFLPLVPNDLFSDHMCWSDTESDKHVTILKQMERAKEKEAIYIGDTQGDEKETHLAGLPFIHAAYGFGKANNPEGVINDVSERQKKKKKLGY